MSLWQSHYMAKGGFGNPNHGIKGTSISFTPFEETHYDRIFVTIL